MKKIENTFIQITMATNEELLKLLHIFLSEPDITHHLEDIYGVLKQMNNNYYVPRPDDKSYLETFCEQIIEKEDIIIRTGKSAQISVICMNIILNLWKRTHLHDLAPNKILPIISKSKILRNVGIHMYKQTCMEFLYEEKNIPKELLPHFVLIQKDKIILLEDRIKTLEEHFKYVPPISGTDGGNGYKEAKEEFNSFLF